MHEFVNTLQYTFKIDFPFIPVHNRSNCLRFQLCCTLYCFLSRSNIFLLDHTACGFNCVAFIVILFRSNIFVLDQTACGFNCVELSVFCPHQTFSCQITLLVVSTVLHSLLFCFDQTFSCQIKPHVVAIYIFRVKIVLNLFSLFFKSKIVLNLFSLRKIFPFLQLYKNLVLFHCKIFILPKVCNFFLIIPF